MAKAEPERKKKEPLRFTGIDSGTLERLAALVKQSGRTPQQFFQGVVDQEDFIRRAYGKMGQGVYLVGKDGKRGEEIPGPHYRAKLGGPAAVKGAYAAAPSATPGEIKEIELADP